MADAAREGFLAGFNEILMLGGIFAFAGAVAALWLVREGDIERGEAAESRCEPRVVPGVASRCRSSWPPEGRRSSGFSVRGYLPGD